MSNDRALPIPKAGASLSERIAALQRKTSNPVRSSNLSPPASASSTVSGRLSPGESPSRSPSGSAGANAVRDRIAKFQSSDEKPVMPRSSFGSPAPNPEIRNARRQFPGSGAGKGTGAWGEGVLRPQMTGGVWLGAGAGGGWGDPTSANLRPQMTGGAFLGNGAPRSASYGASRLQRGVSDNVVHGTGRDAFAELDDDLVLTGRNRPENNSSTQASEDTEEPKEQLASGVASPETADDLPKLPDTPTAEIDLQKIHAASGLGEEPPASKIPEFPEAPSMTPTPSSKVSNAFDLADATPDTSIEIGIHGRSADEVERIRQRAHDLELSDKSTAADEETWIAPAPADLAGQVPKPIDTSELLAAQNQAGKDDGPEPWVQGHGLPTVDRDLEAAGLGSATESQPPPADYAASGSLPERAQVERTDSGRVDPLDPAAHQVRGPGLLVPRDEVAEAKDLGAGAVKAPLAQSAPSERAAAHVSPSNSNAAANVARSPSNGSLTPSGSSATVSTAEKARQVVAMGRTKSQSQRLRRPPPGTMLSAADLDASDDEYEPGWASVTSVMSSSRS